MRCARLLACVDVARPRSLLRHCAHVDLGEFGELGVLTDGGRLLRTPEAAEILGVSRQTVANMVDNYWLRAVITAGGHRRIESASLEELKPVLRMPRGAERDAKIKGIVARNRGEELAE